jgi:hypothetical protein
MSLAAPIGVALLYLDTSQRSPRESFQSRRAF